jgi:hypothetical protein
MSGYDSAVSLSGTFSDLTLIEAGKTWGYEFEVHLSQKKKAIAAHCLI